MANVERIIPMLITAEFEAAVTQIAALPTQQERLAALQALGVQTWPAWETVINNQNQLFAEAKAQQRSERASYDRMAADDPLKTTTGQRLVSRAADWPALYDDLPEELKS